MAFKVGDLVKFKPEEFPVGRGVVVEGVYRVQEVLGIAMVKLRLENVPGVFLEKRFELVEEIAPGKKVVSLVRTNTLKFNHVYTVEKVNGNKVKLVGRPYYYSIDKFAPKKEDAPAAPKPKEETLAEVLKRKVANCLIDSLCAFGVQYKKGDMDFYIDAPCHYKMKGWRNYEEIVGIAHSVTYDMRRRKINKNDKAYREFLHYLLNDSPWKDCYLDKDVDYVMENELRINPEMNQHMVVGSMVAVRTLQEFVGRKEVFLHFFEKGYHPHACYILASFIILSNNNKDFKYNPNGGGHDILAYFLEAKGVFQFFSNGPHTAIGKDKTPYRIDHSGYCLAASVASNENVDDKRIGHWIDSRLKKEHIGEGFNVQKVLVKSSMYKMAEEMSDIFNKGE